MFDAHSACKKLAQRCCVNAASPRYNPNIRSALTAAKSRPGFERIFVLSLFGLPTAVTGRTASHPNSLRLKPMARMAGFDPKDIYSSQAYNLTGLTALGHCWNPTKAANGTPAQASIGIAAFGSIDLNDIAGFHTKYPYLAYNVTVINIDGTPTCPKGETAPCPDGESTLDTEWSTAMSNSYGAATDTAHGRGWNNQG